jgi:exopolyphosphatase / guanosine-5'-triphosphate,3'-diphosphate pyrophosphatase
MTIPFSCVSMAYETLAVVDIGSNTSRVTVFRMSDDGHYQEVTDSRATLQLLRGLSSDEEKASKAIESLMAALRDFHAVAEGAGAGRTVALATYSVRSYPKAEDLVRRIREEIGIEVQIIDGLREAELAFLGAIYGTDVEDGLLVDFGGGSIELASFRRRALLRTWSLPLGALLLNDRFLTDDPPSKSQVRLLQSHVRETLLKAGIRPLKGRERLVATGGTVRNLAKADRQDRRYSIPQLHGYVLSLRRIQNLSRRLSALRRGEVARFRGLNADRKDSIVGGALALLSLFRVLKAEEAVVSGQGLREGFALSTHMSELPAPRSVREVAIESLAMRFSSWNERAAQRRAALAASLQASLDRAAGPDIQESLLHAAWLVDIGKSIDYGGHFQHSASILLATDLAGFSHRMIALLAAILHAADKRRFDWRDYKPWVSGSDESSLKKAGLILALADEVEKRLPPRGGIPLAFHAKRRTTIGLDLPLPYGGRLATLAERFPDVFGSELRFEQGVLHEPAA